MRKIISILLLPLVLLAITFLVQSCYPIGEGGAVFFMCSNCVAPYKVFVYVDDKEIGSIDQQFAVLCTQSCDGLSPVYKGKAGEHTYKIKNSSGSVVCSGTFTIKKQKCVEVPFNPSGCVDSGGGGGGSCNYTSYSGAQNCSQSGSVAVSSTKCCSASAPYWCSSTGYCYASCSDAVSAGCGSIVYGTGQTGGGGGSTCNWQSATNCLTVTLSKSGSRCGDPQSYEITVKNSCNQSIKTWICLQRTDGTWSGNTDGTFSSGVSPGATVSQYVCKGTGYYKLFAMPISTYNASSCGWPSCN
jgi:hypothetical protein